MWPKQWLKKSSQKWSSQRWTMGRGPILVPDEAGVLAEMINSLLVEAREEMSKDLEAMDQKTKSQIWENPQSQSFSTRLCKLKRKVWGGFFWTR